MILTKQQAAVLERLSIAHSVDPGLLVALSRGEACAASRLVERGPVARARERGRVIFGLTPAGEQALVRQVQQLQMFVREPGIDDPHEAHAFRRLEEAVRRWKQEREVDSDKLVIMDAETGIDIALRGIDAVQKRARPA